MTNIDIARCPLGNGITPLHDVTHHNMWGTKQVQWNLRRRPLFLKITFYKIFALRAPVATGSPSQWGHQKASFLASLCISNIQGSSSLSQLGELLLETLRISGVIIHWPSNFWKWISEWNNQEIYRCATCQDLTIYDLFTMLHSHGFNLSLVLPPKQSLKQAGFGYK